MKQEEKNKALIARFKKLSQRGVSSRKLKDIIEQIDWPIEIKRMQRDFELTTQRMANELGIVLRTIMYIKSGTYKPEPSIAKLLEKLGWL